MSAQVLAFSNATTMRNIARVWQLRAQVLEHLSAIEDLCDQIEQLPHVWCVLPDQVGYYLDQVEAMLTPTPLDEKEVEELEAESVGDDTAARDLAEWRAWQAFKKAKGISLED